MYYFKIFNNFSYAITGIDIYVFHTLQNSTNADYEAYIGICEEFKSAEIGLNASVFDDDRCYDTFIHIQNYYLKKFFCKQLFIL